MKQFLIFTNAKYLKIYHNTFNHLVDSVQLLKKFKSIIIKFFLTKAKIFGTFMVNLQLPLISLRIIATFLIKVTCFQTLPRKLLRRSGLSSSRRYQKILGSSEKEILC